MRNRDIKQYCSNGIDRKCKRIFCERHRYQAEPRHVFLSYRRLSLNGSINAWKVRCNLGLLLHPSNSQHVFTTYEQILWLQLWWSSICSKYAYSIVIDCVSHFDLPNAFPVITPNTTTWFIKMSFSHFIVSNISQFIRS